MRAFPSSLGSAVSGGAAAAWSAMKTASAARFSTTSCTRNTEAPRMSAIVSAASVPGRRRSTSASMIPPMNDLRESPTRIGAPKSAEAIEIPDAGMVLLPRLAEADARIEQDPAKGHASARREVERALEEALDVVEDVDRRIRLLPVVHDDDRRAGLRDGVRHAGIALQSPDVVDDAGAEPRRLARDRGLAGVDGDRRIKARPAPRAREPPA